MATSVFFAYAYAYVYLTFIALAFSMVFALFFYGALSYFISSFNSLILRISGLITF
jgi:hypothetical protein